MFRNAHLNATVALLLLAGCATPPDGAPLSQGEVMKLLDRARDPRRYSLTVYRSDTGPVYANANRLHPGQRAEMPFRSGLLGDAPVIELTDRYQKIRVLALVDTTSKHSWLDRETYAALGCYPLAPPAVPVPTTSVQSEAPGFLCTPEKLILNELHIETPLFWFRASRDKHLGPLARGEKPARLGAVIGCDLLKAFGFASFDFQAGVLTLDNARSYRPDPTRLMQSIPYTMQGGQLGIPGALEGRPTTVLLDVAGDFALAVPDPAEPVRLVSAGALVFQAPKRVSTRERNLGNPDLPRLGRQLLERYVVTLDRKAGVVHFEKPAPRPLLSLP